MDCLQVSSFWWSIFFSLSKLFRSSSLTLRVVGADLQVVLRVTGDTPVFVAVLVHYVLGILLILVGLVLLLAPSIRA